MNVVLHERKTRSRPRLREDAVPAAARLAFELLHDLLIAVVLTDYDVCLAPESVRHFRSRRGSRDLDGEMPRLTR
jgi:hypothetical protein